jgi:transglycosylase-like protein with SLT domain
MAETTGLPPLEAAATVPTDPAQAAGQTSLPAPSAAPVVPTGPGGLPPLTAAPVVGSADTGTPAPTAQSSALPAPSAVPTNEPMSEKTTGILDTLLGHSHIMQDVENKVMPVGDPTSDALKRVFTGPGSMFGTNPAEKDLPGTENESWIKRKAAILGQTSKYPLANFNNAITPEERAAQPHAAAVLDPVAKTLTSLTTPASLSFMGVLGIMESLPKFVESELVANGASAAVAARTSKIAQTGLTALGAYFSVDQIASALESIPEAGQALLHGEYDKAIGLITSGVINGAIGGSAFHSTYHSLHDLVPESTSAKAMANKDYSDAVHADNLTKQVGGARSETLAQLGRASVAEQLKREQITEYVDAKGSRNLMAARQKETQNPVSPADRIAQQGGIVPLENTETKTNPEETNKVAAENTPATAATSAEKVQPKRVVPTLGPATTDEAGAITHPILVDGKEVGNGKVTIDGDRATVDWVGGNAKDTTTGTTGKGELTNKLGLRGMRDLASQFLEQHPEINTVEGQRIGGANAGNLHPVEFTRDQLLPKTVQTAIDENPTFVSKAAAQKLGLFIDPKVTENEGLFSEEAKTNAAKPAEGQGGTFVTPAAAQARGLFSEEAITNAQKPGTATPEHWASPAAQQSAETATSVARAEEAARAHIITPEERDLMVKQQDPNFKLTPKQEKDVSYAREQINKLGQRAQNLGILGKDQLKDWFVPREWDFEDASDPTKATLYDSHHEGQMHGLVAKNKDYYALVSDYYRKMTNRIANTELVTRLKTGRTSDGAPLAVGGGFVEGQRVSAEGPQSHIMGDAEILRLKQKGQFTKLIDSGRIVANPDKSFTMKTDDYVAAKNLYEVRPIGPTPIPPEIVKEMQTDGTLDKLKQKNLVYQNEKGEWMNKTQLYARVPVYVHPDISEHMNEVMRAREAAPTTQFGRSVKGYDDVQGKMKNMLLSWSPFHRMTESLRMMESLGLVKGGTLAARTNIPGFNALMEKIGVPLPPKVDYFNLTSEQEAAIRDGIVVTDPRGQGPNNVQEGLSGGSQNFSYNLADKSIGRGVEAAAKKFGASPELAATIRRNINPQKILTDDVFGPHGMISDAKFQLYADRKPLIADQIAKDHPSWSPEQIDVQAGRLAAQFANDKFGGLNYVLLGRALSTQRIMRRLMLAPDFLESTGRSIVDVAGTHGSTMAANLLRFNIAHLLTAAGLNLALHHDENDKSAQGILKSSHILDHPYGLVSPDGKSVYGLRTTATDFIHMLNQPKEFMYNRVAPPLRAAAETITKRNEYGRRESQFEAAKSIPKAGVPIQFQGPLGLGPNTTTEPSAKDQFLKSIGIQAKPNRTNAEQLAIDKVSAHLQGTEARSGQALVRSQLKFNAEDNLRSALEAQKAAKETGADPAAAKARVDAAQHAIQTLADKKVLNPEEVKSTKLAAQSSRLVSIFNSLDPKDALDVWDAGTEEERTALSPYMQQKYGHWREKLAKQGQNFSQLNEDDQQIQDHFQQARIQANEAFRRPLPPPPAAKTKPTPGATAEKASSGTESESALPPPQPVEVLGASPEPPKAPEIYKNGDYTPVINDAAKKYGVDPTLVEAIMHRESAGNPNAQSNKGAMGLMQLEPATAKQYGVTDIKDPQQNIDAGTHYISDLLKQYDGDEKKALAAYNAGPTAVAQYNGVPPFKETKDYVKAVQDHKTANYQNSTEFKPTEEDAKMFQTWPKTGPTAPGMVKPGNIDLTKRPVVHRADGSVSTLYSASFGTDEGEVLVPQISDKGKVLTIEEAKKQYEKDGKSLGVFKTPEQADEYANYLHKQQGKFQVWSNGGQYRPTVETHSDK